MNKLANALKKVLDKKQDAQSVYSAILGDGENNVAVSGQPNHVYYRVGGEIGIAYNDVVPAENDRMVWIGTDAIKPHKARVLGAVSSRRRYGEDDRTITFVPNHARQHQYPNADTVYIHTRQIMPLRVTPISDFELRIYKGFVNVGGVYYAVNSQDIDLTDYQITDADTGSRAKWLLIEAVAGSGSATINIVEGDEVDFEDLPVTDLPLPSSNLSVELAVIRIWSGQTAIEESRTQTDIIDLRFSKSASLPSSSPAFTRVLQNDLTLADTQTIVTIDYINTADYTLTLEGDAAMEIL